jgi:hypothetical protein
LSDWSLLLDLWLQGLAIVLPQVQQELNPVRVEYAVLAEFAGLIVGATTWGIMADLIGRRLSFNVSYTLKVGGRLFDLRLKDYTLSLGPIWIGSSRCTEFCGILFPYSMHGLWSRRQVSAPMFMGARINLITFDVCGGI